MNDRETAMKWWNALDGKEKSQITFKTYGLTRSFISLTGREIEAIYKRLQKLNQRG